METATPRPSYPSRKISETFLAFAEPLLATLPSNHTIKQIETALNLAFAVWNAVVFADTGRTKEFLTDIRTRSASHPVTAALLEDLIERKRLHFSNDERLIGEWHVKATADGFTVHAEARDPRPQPPPTAAPFRPRR